ncbi:MAG: nicotinate-nucleotide adenylyltransferase [Clostridiaceae bacterium]|nr:nicotinate-nucleotide adenylyltransferase [Clostridiaceae bacterium]
MEKLGLMGGSFDPIHLAHLYIAENTKEKLHLDKVILIPAGSQPLKQDKRVTDASLRFNMVKKAIEGREGLEVSDYEIKKGGISYTFETLEYFTKKDRKLFFITGADCLMSLEKWKCVDTILRLSTLVVCTRPGYNEEELYKQKLRIEKKFKTEIILLNLPGIDISSTDIRKRICEKKDIDKYLPVEVIKIINENKLYGEV